jgi:hypothetical protein
MRGYARLELVAAAVEFAKTLPSMTQAFVVFARFVFVRYICVLLDILGRKNYRW